MTNLKFINESLLKETIKENIILEAIDANNINLLADQIEKLSGVINSSMSSFASLKTALNQAENEANQAVTNPKKSGDIIAKIISFYSKIWNFISNDLKALSRLPAMRDFFDPTKTQDDNSILSSNPKAEEIKQQIVAALKNDNSPWFKKALATLTKNTNFVSDIPYLNTEQFIQEFMNTPRSTLKAALEGVSNQIRSVQNPEAVSKTLTNADPKDTQGKAAPEIEQSFRSAQAELNKLYDKFVSQLGEKGQVPDNQVKLKQLIVNSFMANETPEALSKKVQEEIK